MNCLFCPLHVWFYAINISSFVSWLFIIFIYVVAGEAHRSGVAPDSATYSQMLNTQGHFFFFC
jgi:hypothetical protein